MTELSIKRGRDIDLSVNGHPLCGVTHFSAVTKRQRHELCEYLCGEPYAACTEGESHELVLTVLSLFAGGIPQEDGFTLSVEDGETEYCYENCTVVKIERDIRGDKAVIDRYTVRAVSMTQRRMNDA